MMSLPQLPSQLWSWSTKSAPAVETWTITATSATSFTVVGSVSGAQTNATIDTPYAAANGVSFQVSAGGTPFVAGDKFVFDVVDHFDLSKTPGVQQYTIPPTGVLELLDTGMSLYSENRSGSTVVVYESGYLALTRNNADPIDDFGQLVRKNTPLPARLLQHDNAVTILPFWDELTQKATSKIRTLATSSSGQQVFVVEYSDFAHKNDATASYTFQVVLFENDNHVRFHYIKLQNGTFSAANGSSATVGLQGNLTNQYTASMYSTNTASLVDGLAIDFGVDNDGDRLPSPIEQQYGTSDSTPFTDGGATQLTDAAQLVAGIDPTDPADNGSKSTDTDGDTIPDANEVVYGTNPAAADTDGDGVPDNLERTFGYNPLVADTDGDGLSDGTEDADKDGTTNGSTESHPLQWDTDGDGVGDGTEVAQGSDKLDDQSGRMSPEIVLGPSTAYGMSTAVDSKGNLHVAWALNSSDSIPNDLYVALFRRNPTTMRYEVAVAATLIDAHAGLDDRIPAIVTVPGSNPAVDQTIIFNHSRGGYAFLTTIDFGLSALDGNASTSAAIVKSSRMLDFPVAVNHPQMKLAGNKLHVVFQGQEILGTSTFYDQHIARGTYYVQLDLDGTVTVPPVEMFRKETPSHHHTHPRIAIDSAGNVHSVVRGGSCAWDYGPASCALYYTKLSATGTVLVPTTKLQLEGNGGIHRGLELLVSANGLVNVIYVTQAPLVTGSGVGGYSVGNEVRMHSFATVNNGIQTVINQKVLLSVAPDITMGLPANHRANTFRTPTATLDAGGNIHLLVPEDNNLSQTGLYFAFDPSGARKLGPYRIESIEYQADNTIQVNGNDVFFVYKYGRPRFRHLDITGHGLDLSGGSQVPVPEAQDLTLSAVTPPNAAAGTTAIVTAIGSGFVNGTTFSIGGVAVTGIVSFRPTNLTGAIDTTGLTEGPYDVIVTNPDGTSVTLEKGFYVGDLPVTPTGDDGCCDLSGSNRSPVGSLLLVGLVALGLRRRRHRKSTATIAAIIACAYVALSPAPASAALGVRDENNWAWADNKTGMPGVIARYTTVPKLSAGATGNGTVNHPTLATQLWSWTTSSIVAPLETWTLTATSSTTFAVVGSISGALPDATVGTPYTTTAGMNFTITAGGTAFAAGDTFTFQVVDHVDPSTIPGAVSSSMAGNMKLITAPFAVRTEGRASSGMVAFRAGYLAIATTNPRIVDDFGPQQLPNTTQPARVLEHSSAVPVMPFWDELITKPTSKIWTAAWGRSGSRMFVVEYNDFAHKDDPTASYTFQVVFFEGADRVRFHYIKLQNGTGTSANGSTATIGLQGHLYGTFSAAGYSANTPSLVEGLVIEYGTDSDGDRIPAGVEAQYGTNANATSTDGGSPVLSDSAQFVAGINPTDGADNVNRSADADGDTILDAEEAIYGTNPSMVDSDGDGLNDNLELNLGTSPTLADTDGDGLSDGTEDADKSGTTEVTETSATTWDTDGDGISDGQEVAHGTDKLLDTSSRLLAAIELGAVEVHGISTAIDSKGNLHVAWAQRARNSAPDDLYVALLTPMNGTYQFAVAPTLLNMHTGVDDRTPSITTAPGAPGSTVDRTVMINSSHEGFAFFTELDFGLATRDGTATTPATIVTASRMLNFPLSVNHPIIKVSGNKVHVVFQGAAAFGNGVFYVKGDKGSYYVQLDADGTVVVPPIELFKKSSPAHHHSFPRMALDSSGNVHTVVRGGTCRWDTGTSDCGFYYTKLSSTGTVMIPTTMLQLRGNGGMHKSPEILVSPNGLVNVIYTTIAPLVGTAGYGGYTYGNEVQLHSFWTLNNRITTVIDQKPLMSVVPERWLGLADNVGLPTYRTPAATLDAGGNIHLFVREENNRSDGFYAAFDPSGTRKLGPYRIPDAGEQQAVETIQVSTNDRVLFAYSGNNGYAWFQELDITGSGLDLTGGSQVPLPEGESLTVTAVAPNSVEHRGRTSVTVAGTGFAQGATITIGGVVLTSVNAYNSGNLLGDFDAETLVDGVYDVTVTNPDGSTATLPAAFTVGTPPVADDGCCETGRGRSPAGAFLLALGVALVLGRRRRRS